MRHRTFRVQPAFISRKMRARGAYILVSQFFPIAEIPRPIYAHREHLTAALDLVHTLDIGYRDLITRTRWLPAGGFFAQVRWFTFQ